MLRTYSLSSSGEQNRRCQSPRRGSLSLPFAVVDPNLRQSIPQRVPREPQQARSLRLVAPRALQSFADHFVFPLIEGHAVGKKAIGRSVGAIARRIKLNVADFQLATRGERAGAFDDVLQFTHIPRPIMTREKLHGGGRNTGDSFRSSGIFGKARKKQLRQSSDILFVFAQRRVVDRGPVEPVLKGFATSFIFQRRPPPADGWPS